MSQEQRTRPATGADFHRLADLAHERGLEVIVQARPLLVRHQRSTPTPALRDRVLVRCQGFMPISGAAITRCCSSGWAGCLRSKTRRRRCGHVSMVQR